MKAIEIGSHTLVGVYGDPPHDHGNCFSVLADDGCGYDIVNFNYENLHALMGIGLKLPIEIEALGPRTAVVMDPRIGERWYQWRYCEVCCPGDLLPVTQRQSHTREIARGRRIEGNGLVTIRFDVAAPEFN